MRATKFDDVDFEVGQTLYFIHDNGDFLEVWSETIEEIVLSRTAKKDSATVRTELKTYEDGLLEEMIDQDRLVICLEDVGDTVNRILLEKMIESRSNEKDKHTP